MENGNNKPKNFKQLIEKNLLGDMNFEKRQRLMSNFTEIDNRERNNGIIEKKNYLQTPREPQQQDQLSDYRGKVQNEHKYSLTPTQDRRVIDQNSDRKSIYAGLRGNLLLNPIQKQQKSKRGSAINLSGDPHLLSPKIEFNPPIEIKEDKTRCIIITVLCLVNLTANSAYSSIAPFFPYEAALKGVPTATFGFIFSGYSISMCIFAPLFSHMLTRYGRKNVLMLGCFCESIAMFCFGFFIYIEDPTTYAIMCFLCRFIEGFGNGCLNSSTSSIISYNYEDNQSNLIGLTQTFTGLGMLSGPIIGSFLYELGGFKLPFFVTGAALFILIFPIAIYLKNDHNSQETTPESSSNNEDNEMAVIDEEDSSAQNVSFFGALSYFQIFTTALCSSNSLMCLTFKEPLLQIRLKQENLPVWLIGIVFSMDTITYTITSFVLNFIKEENKNFIKLVAVGQLSFILSMIFQGPTPRILPDKVGIICVGILFGGVGGALTNNNVVPAFNQILEGINIKDKNQMKNIISSINTGAFGFGSILGPILASLMESGMNYRSAFAVITIPVFIIFLIQSYSAFFFKAKKSISQRSSSKNTEDKQADIYLQEIKSESSKK